MAASKDSLLDLERRRAQLEETVANLRKSLQYWQTWEAEYEGLKEEISALGGKPSSQKLEEIGKDYGGVVLNENEIKLLLEDGKGQKRDAAQILGLLSRRIDYVQENVKVSNKRLLAAEDTLSAVDIVIRPEARAKDGLPLTEIIEELDDDGNVISSSISTPGEAASQVVDTLRKAGLKDLPDPRQQAGPIPPSAEPPSVPDGQSIEKVLSADKAAAVTFVPNRSLSTQNPESSPKRQKKSVSFAENTKKADSSRPKISPSANRKSSAPFSSTAVQNGRLARDQNRPVSRDNSDEFVSSPVIPADESPEDAALRRQMLQYNLNEVGAIVAEMDLEEADSSEDYSEDPDDDYGSTTDEEEDQFGRTTKRVVDDGYRQQMLELERKLDAKMLINIGPDPVIPTAATDHEERKVDKATNEKPISSTKAEDDQNKGRKGVRFADELDVAAAPRPKPAIDEQVVTLDNVSRPVSDVIIERSELPHTSTIVANTPRKVSKFRNAQTAGLAKGVQNHNDERPISNGIANGPLAQSRTGLPFTPASQSRQKAAPLPLASATEARSRVVPEGPLGKTHAEVLIERPTVQTYQEVIEPDEFDPALMQQELAVEYYRMRNRMIQRNGGFVQDEEPAQTPLSEDGEGEGGGRKISKFKAARLGRLTE